MFSTMQLTFVGSTIVATYYFSTILGLQKFWAIVLKSTLPIDIEGIDNVDDEMIKMIDQPSTEGHDGAKVVVDRFDKSEKALRDMTMPKMG